MRKMDYSIGMDGPRKSIITALTERAKLHTPEPLTFDDKQKALAFLKEGQAEGYRFSGKETVDPEQPLVKNGYFANVNGQLIPCGQDWGPVDTVWEVGDVKPGQARNTGGQSVVERIIGGDEAKKHGFGLMFILRQKDISKVN